MLSCPKAMSVDDGVAKGVGANVLVAVAVGDADAVGNKVTLGEIAGVGVRATGVAAVGGSGTQAAAKISKTSNARLMLDARAFID